MYSSQLMSIELTDTDNSLPLDDQNFTNLVVSHYDCEKQHNLCQFNVLNVKYCTEAPSNIQHTTYKHSDVKPMQRENER